MDRNVQYLLQLYDWDLEERSQIESVAITTFLNEFMGRLTLSAVWDSFEFLSPYQEHFELLQCQHLNLYAEYREDIKHFE